MEIHLRYGLPLLSYRAKHGCYDVRHSSSKYRNENIEMLFISTTEYLIQNEILFKSYLPTHLRELRMFCDQLFLLQYFTGLFIEECILSWPVMLSQKATYSKQ